MYDSQLLRSCQAVYRLSQRLRGRGFLGRRLDLRLAGGTEATDTRDYTTGDDYRYVDWNRCMRHDELLSRQFHGTEQQHITLLLDVSESMLGSGGAKLETARRLAAVFGYLALRRGDTLALAEYSEGLHAVSHDFHGFNRLPQLGSRLAAVRARPGVSDLQRSAESLARRTGRRGLVVLLSDLLDRRGFEPALDLLARSGFEPFVMLLLGEEDLSPSWSGALRLVERESGRGLSAAITEQDIAAYRRAAERFLAGVRRFCSGRGFGAALARSGEAAEATALRVLAAASRLEPRLSVG